MKTIILITLRPNAVALSQILHLLLIDPHSRIRTSLERKVLRKINLWRCGDHGRSVEDRLLPLSDRITGADAILPKRAPQQLNGIKLECLGHVDEFDHVQATLTGFIFRNELLKAAESSGDQLLTQPEGFALLGELHNEASIALLMNPFCHSCQPPFG